MERYSYNEAIALLTARLGSDELARDFPVSWELPDEEKICGINED